MENYNFYGSHKYLIVPLIKMDEEIFLKEEITSPRIKVFEFTDPEKFGKSYMLTLLMK